MQWQSGKRTRRFRRLARQTPGFKGLRLGALLLRNCTSVTMSTSECRCVGEMWLGAGRGALTIICITSARE